MVKKKYKVNTNKPLQPLGRPLRKYRWRIQSSKGNVPWQGELKEDGRRQIAEFRKIQSADKKIYPARKITTFRLIKN